MAQAPGIAFMPTTLLNAALGLLPDPTLPVRGPDRLAAVVPMFDEEAGAADALASLLAQRVALDQVVISINGGRDATPAVVAATLAAAGYGRAARGRWGVGAAPVELWRRPSGGPSVAVIHHDRQVAKADSLNQVVAGGLVVAERVLVLDGDTVLDPGFVAALRDGFYRLRAVRRGGRTEHVIEDVAIQSGAVTSMRPRAPGVAAGLVSAARTAEYAFATLVRRGQVVRWGRGSIFGATRLYTVIGCGFAVRRDGFPVPADTATEDHDLTLAVQGGPTTSRRMPVAELHRRGFRVVVDGAERPLHLVAGDGEIELRTTPHARFEAGAAMATEDPPRLAAYLRQVERWVGGGLENLGKRVRDPRERRAWRPNVRFAVLGAQLENLLGLVLLLGMPAWLGSAWSTEGPTSVARAAALWLLADLAATGLLVTAGAWIQARARGRGAWTALGFACRGVAGVVPLLVLRPLNVLAYAAAATRVAPRFLGGARAGPDPTKTWDRPRAIFGVARGRTLAVAAVMTTVGLGGFVGSAHVAATVRPLAWEHRQHLQAGPSVDLRLLATLPVAEANPGRSAVQAPEDHGAASGRQAGERGEGIGSGPSAFCDPSSAAAAASAPRRLDERSGPHEPLTAWGLLTLARLVPILALIEEAGTTYDLPPALLLQVLLNESYLDPLAVGPTDDVGLSQMTGDALRLLRSISNEPGSRFANGRLFARPFSVFDPDFSVCAGAAKLAWVRHLPWGDDPEIAYARYVNPQDGAADGRVSASHRPLVDAFVAVGPMVDALVAVVGAYRQGLVVVSPAERALLGVADAAARGDLTVEGAYRAAGEVIAAIRIDDQAFYRRVLTELYGRADELADAPAPTLAAAP